jgi:hypothetical protein
MFRVCMQVLRIDPVTGRNVYCALPTTDKVCVLCVTHAAQAQRIPTIFPESPEAGANCRRCKAPVMDDGGFYECERCGDAELVAA